MPDFTRAEKRAAIQREIKMRRRVYPRWVGEQRMTQAKAEHEIALMEAILSDYPDEVEPDLFSARAP